MSLTPLIVLKSQLGKSSDKIIAIALANYQYQTIEQQMVPMLSEISA